VDDTTSFVNCEEKNEWVLNKAGVKKDLLKTIKGQKLAYYAYIIVAWRKR